jgi:excinuclease UvrABC nuclease subunit
MEWESEDNNDQRIIAYTAWLSIEVYQTIETLEKRTGVYIFADINKRVKYIGKASIDRMINEIYNALCRDKGKGATLVKALYTNSDIDTQSLETDLINKYNPLNNR